MKMEGRQRNAHRVFMGMHKETDHFKDLGKDGRILLKLILKKQNRKM